MAHAHVAARQHSGVAVIDKADDAKALLCLLSRLLSALQRAETHVPYRQSRVKQPLRIDTSLLKPAQYKLHVD